MSGIIPFDFETNAVRVAMIDYAPWFVAADVCRVLEISNPRDAIARLEDDERDDVGVTDTIRRQQQMNIVSESGLYALIFTSRKPAAKRFRKWVTSEVLPTLRREGAYVMPEAENAARDSDFMTIPKDDFIAMLTKTNTLLTQHNDLLGQIIKAAPKPRRKARQPVTSAEKAKIIALAMQGLSNGEIARQTGRSRATISLLRNGFRIINGGGRVMAFASRVTQDLLRLADAYCAHKFRTEEALSGMVAGKGGFFKRLRRGGIAPRPLPSGR